MAPGPIRQLQPYPSLHNQLGQPYPHHPHSHPAANQPGHHAQAHHASGSQVFQSGRGEHGAQGGHGGQQARSAAQAGGQMGQHHGSGIQQHQHLNDAQPAPIESRGRRPFSHRGLFTKDIRNLMYAYGDSPTPDPASVALMEEMTIDFLTDLCHRARPSPYSLNTPSTYPPASRARVKVDDFKFALRKDTKKLARLEELLYLDRVIANAKRMFDETDGGEHAAAAGTEQGVSPGTTAEKAVGQPSQKADGRLELPGAGAGSLRPPAKARG